MIPRYLSCVTAVYTGRFCGGETMDERWMADGWFMQAAIWVERAKNEGGDLYTAITQAYEHPEVVWL